MRRNTGVSSITAFILAAGAAHVLFAVKSAAQEPPAAASPPPAPPSEKSDSAASQANSPPSPAPVAPKAAFALPSFKVSKGAPARTVPMATRAGGKQVDLCVITPEGVAKTFAEQPSFFWYQSVASENNIIFNLYDPASWKVVLKHRVPGTQEPGIHRLDLSEHDGKLETGVTYQWSITYETDPQSPSQNAVSKGAILRVAAPAEVSTRLTGADAAATAGIYAEHGAWYDLFAAVSDLIEKNPQAPELQAYRESLIRQSGLAGMVK